MEENENIFDKLHELYGSNAGSFNILEHQIDIDLQVQYFELSRQVKKGLSPQMVMSDSEQLFSERADEKNKKEILAKLASVEEVEAFRIIERYYEVAPEEMKAWSALALQESKMMLESMFLDENQVLISTGLGGKGQKLRYFVVLMGRSEDHLTNLQKRIIKNEFSFVLDKHDSEVENIDFSGTLVTVMAVVPMNEPVKGVFEEAINECNNYGDFLEDNFIITNVKELSFEEIRGFLKNTDHIDNSADEENFL